MLGSTSPAHPSIPYETHHFPSYTSATDFASSALQQPQAKKRKTERACDACRRKKTRCDGPSAANNVCTNCIQSKKACTYIEGSKPRGPPKAYVTGLEDRVEELEALLAQIKPGVDFSEQLGPPIPRGSWKHADGTKKTDPRVTPPIQAASPLPPLAIPFPRKRTRSLNRPAAYRTTHLLFKPPRSLKTKKSRLSPEMVASGGSGSSPATSPQSDLTTHRSSSYTPISDSEDPSGSSDSGSEDIDIVETSAGGRYRFSLDMSETPTSESSVNRILFHGRGGGTAGLVEATRRFKFLHLQESMKMDTREDQPLKEEEPELKNIDILKVEGPDNYKVAMTRRPLFWQTSPWEHDFQKMTSASPLDVIPHLVKFPPPDLCRTLIDLYFTHTNNYFPLLHRPTFERQWKERLCEKNIWFAAVCFQIFAIGSRWCNDERVLGAPESSASEARDWTKAGWHYHSAGADIHKMARSLIYTATLFEIQSYSLMANFLRGTAYGPTAWMVVSIGLRKAHDVGAHRKGLYQSEPNASDELWKRAFWLLLIFDRVGAVSLGRSVSLGEEDFDLDLPLEVNDEYWSGPNAWTQPEGVPSNIAGFNHFIRITQIMAFTVKTVYAVDREKIFRGLVEGDWRVEIVTQLNAAMEIWLENMPSHLKWSEDIEDPFFFAQSAMLHTNYHLCKMHIYRHFIPAPPMFHPSSPGEREVTPPPQLTPPPFPALAICVTAARMCAKIVEVQLSKGSWDYILVPALIHALYIPAATLILALWDLKAQQKVLIKVQSAGIIDHAKASNGADKGDPHSDAHPEELLIALEKKMRQLVSEVTVLLDALEWVRPRWECVHRILHDLKQSLPREEDLEIKLGSLKPPSTFSHMSFQDLRKKREQEQQEVKSHRKPEPKPLDLSAGIEDSYVPLTHWPPRDPASSRGSSPSPAVVSGADVVRLMQQHELHTFAEDEFEGVHREASIQLPRLAYGVSSAPQSRESMPPTGSQHSSSCQCLDCTSGNATHSERPQNRLLRPYAQTMPPTLPSVSFNASPPFISSSMRRTSGMNSNAEEYSSANPGDRSLFEADPRRDYVPAVQNQPHSSGTLGNHLQPGAGPSPHAPHFDARLHHSTPNPSGGDFIPPTTRGTTGQGPQAWKATQGGLWNPYTSNNSLAYWEASPSPPLAYMDGQQPFSNDAHFQSRNTTGNTPRYQLYAQSQHGPGRDYDPTFSTTYGS
ncbi:fungal-specific transcription factor domain-containing protein [Coprinopsis sp. MPI-PUGE-AT-0042]|nr:fungal-specific transcription factor domain-containing protein [Coprinopsis sp. MPI-PUGE-AT-0042]